MATIDGNGLAAEILRKQELQLGDEVQLGWYSEADGHDQYRRVRICGTAGPMIIVRGEAPAEDHTLRISYNVKDLSVITPMRSAAEEPSP